MQPTQKRHRDAKRKLIGRWLAEDDVFVDVGSGLGHVPLLVSLVTGAQSLGIEVEAAYVASAREAFVRFFPQGARDADLSNGTMFYLYSPSTARYSPTC